jgi:hypothetical protein
LSNCIIFAWTLYRRRRAKARRDGKVFRGYVSIRVSWSGEFPHFIYTEIHGRKSPRFVHYGPVRRVDDKLFPPPCFVGKVVWGDAVIGRPNNGVKRA